MVTVRPNMVDGFRLRCCIWLHRLVEWAGSLSSSGTHYLVHTTWILLDWLILTFPVHGLAPGVDLVSKYKDLPMKKFCSLWLQHTFAFAWQEVCVDWSKLDPDIVHFKSISSEKSGKPIAEDRWFFLRSKQALTSVPNKWYSNLVSSVFLYFFFKRTLFDCYIW